MQQGISLHTTQTDSYGSPIAAPPERQQPFSRVGYEMYIVQLQNE